MFHGNCRETANTTRAGVTVPSLEDTMETLKNENWTRIALAVEDPANRSYVVTMAMLLCLGLTMCVPPHPAAAGSPPPRTPRTAHPNPQDTPTNNQTRATLQPT